MNSSSYKFRELKEKAKTWPGESADQTARQNSTPVEG